MGEGLCYYIFHEEKRILNSDITLRSYSGKTPYMISGKSY